MRNALEKNMAMQRGKLTKSERRKLQHEYHKGTEARKRVMRDLFGQGLTYSSGMAHSNAKIEDKKKNAFAACLEGSGSGAVIGPHSDMTESEFWDWVCRVAWHGILWAHPRFGGSIPFWVELHRMYAGWGFRIEEKDAVKDTVSWFQRPFTDIDSDETYRLLVPNQVPPTLRTRAWQTGQFILVNSVRGVSAVVYAALGATATILLQRAFGG